MHCERVLARGSFRHLLQKMSSKDIEYIASGILPFYSSRQVSYTTQYNRR